MAPLDAQNGVEPPLRMCHASQAAIGAVVALAFGWVATAFSGTSFENAVLAGTQSLVQLAVQISGAALGAYGISIVDGNWFNNERVDVREAPGAHNQLEEPGGLASQVGVRLIGASGGAAASWLIFPAGLDFSLAASSLLIASGAVGAALLTERKREEGGINGEEAPKQCLLSVLLGFSSRHSVAPAPGHDPEEVVGLKDTSVIADTVGHQAVHEDHV